MDARPKYKIELSMVDKIVEAVSLTLLFVLWISTITFFSKLPDQIPSHFNAAGKADGFSNKANIFILPFIATIIYSGMTILNRHPHLYNYSTTLTAQNARRLYTSAAKVVRILKLAVVIIFNGIVFFTIKTALVDGSGIGAWFLPTVIALLVVPNIIYLIKSSNAKQASG